MVSPVDGPGPPPGVFLPVPTDNRAVVEARRTLDDQQARAGARTDDRRARQTPEAVAVPIGQDLQRGDTSRSNPFLDRGEAFRRPLFSGRPNSPFLAQAIGQDGEGQSRTASEEAARRYRGVQEVIDREAARRRGPPGLDLLT